MCGIVGYVGPRPAAPILVDGLKRLEYRGYDSAGLAVHAGSGIEIRRAVGKLRNLEGLLLERPLEGIVGIGHTRWATHGRPSEVNAHPHVSGDVAVVHNGIIENHVALRRELKSEGFEIQSETDTELVAHLIEREVRTGKDLLAAVLAAIARLEGAYAIAVLDHARPHQIVVARASSPLVLGVGDGEMFCASDVPALLPYTRDMIFLEDGDVAVLEPRHITLLDTRGDPVERPTRRIDWSPAMAEKAGYKHFMLKEIFEQPRAIEDTLRGRLDRTGGDVFDQEIGLTEDAAKELRRVIFLACGTSHHATIAGRYWVEELAGIPAVSELASEFRGRDPIVGEGDLVVAVSQSGETIDTLIAAREAKRKGAKVLAVVNVIDSAIARMADAVFYTHAGPEIGVASTKCFTTQLANLLMLSLWIGRRRGTLAPERCRELVEGLAQLPQQMQETLQGTRQLVANLAKRTRDARDVLFLGRGLSFPIALEGALKLKEISYVHAEGYAAGEMKHGPIALIDEHVPVFVLLPRDEQYERSFSNLQEAKARDARVIAVATSGDEAALDQSDDMLEVPKTLPQLTPFLTVLPLQLFAYYVADFKGTDVDQPRNLAKTVTVE
jgi:glutamine---fructose-6-phosphate transaminase (isomerizing)